MREILFRGKAKNDTYTKDGEWIYSSFIMQDPKKELLSHEVELFSGDKWVAIDPESLGQYTGLTDKNGKKIFEGDIVKAQDDIFGSPFCNGITGKVVYEETAFFIEPQNVMETEWLFNECAVYEVIGNIHDNPELLGGVNI